MRTRSRTTTAAAALTAALALTLTACSDDDSSANGQADNSNTADASENDRTDDAPDQDQEAALIADLNAYTTAYFEPDAETAYNMMSERCRGQVTLEEYAPAIEQAAADFGALEAEDITVDQIEGSMARVSYVIGGMPAFEREQQPWVYEDGQWRFDAC